MLRRFLAVVATIGLIASIGGYFASFFGLTTGPVSNSRPWSFIFFVGIFAVSIPFWLTESSGAISDQMDFPKRFAAARPRWAYPSIQLAFLFFAAHFIWFLVLTHGCALDIVDGQYVLRDREILSEARYLFLAGWETRFFASFMICVYLYMTLYWWYPRVKTKTGPNPYDEYQ